MKRDDALAILRAALPDLRREFSVRSLALFGSTARDEAREDSDVDVIVEYDKTPGMFEFVGLKDALEDRLQRPVDLATPKMIKPRIRDAVFADRVYA